MCAINPKHKKRFILDVYTSNPNLSKEAFDALVINLALKVEQELNQIAITRWHIKETEQEAN